MDESVLDPSLSESSRRSWVMMLLYESCLKQSLIEDKSTTSATHADIVAQGPPACHCPEHYNQEGMAASPSRSPEVDLGRSDSSNTVKDGATAEATDAATSDTAAGEAGASSGSPSGAAASDASRQRQAERTDADLPPTKRTRTMVQDAEGRNRQRRLFGVLTKTLSKFQEETKKETEAVRQPPLPGLEKSNIAVLHSMLTRMVSMFASQSKRRQAVEERLAAKLREENQALEAKTGKERARRNLKFEIIKKEDERNAFVAIVRFCSPLTRSGRDSAKSFVSLLWN